jgi:peptidoglycan/LPS O-acetylase OafA/YrhL
MKRILPLDGLRAIAAFGVVWIHVWSYMGNPSLSIGGLDIYKILSIVGNGVDLFFVISGFCMYMMYGRIPFSWEGFLDFIKKRWLRIAPAYYFAVVVYAVILLIINPGFTFVKTVLLHFLFLQNFNFTQEISGPFWSLATEWFFYFLLPAFFNLSAKFGFKKIFIISFLLSIFFGLVAYFPDPFSWSKSVIVRFTEFLWGVLAAKLYFDNSLSKFSLLLNFWVGIGIAYVGRLLMLTEVVRFAGQWGFIFKTLSYSVMTLGFTIILLTSINKPTEKFSLLLSSNIFRLLGRLSYSVYLWHSLVIFILAPFLKEYLYVAFLPLKTFLAFIVISLFTFGISFISYKYLEEPYFKKRVKLQIN